MKILVRVVFFAFFLFIILLPVVSATPGFNSAAGQTYQLTEDTPYSYNFTANVTNPETNMNFSFEQIKSTVQTSLLPGDYPWIAINSTTGIMVINATKNNQTGMNNISVKVLNQVPEGTVAVFFFNISAVNDAPQFVNLTDRTLDGSAFQLNLTATDEEEDNNFTFNVSFRTCTRLSPSDCILFNLTYLNTTAANISFTPQSNQEGVYEINFSVMDNRSAIRSQLVNWTIDLNDLPSYRYVCNNERNATENSQFTCWINVTDTDETNNLTITANYTWFLFNNSQSNSLTINVSNYNASFFVNFTPADIAVGNWSINITVSDNGRIIGRNSTLINFSIINVNDAVSLIFISNYTLYTSENTTIYINASDDDLLVPDKLVFNESLTFISNNTNVSRTSSSAISGTNISSAAFLVSTGKLGVGNHTINITVNDTTGNYASQVFRVQVLSNNAPVWSATARNNYTLNESTNFYLNLSGNATDADGTSLNFSFINYTSFPSFSINRTTAIINFTPEDGDVGEHIINITATDGISTAYLQINFTIHNINDTPMIETPLSVSGTGTTIDSKSNINVTRSNQVTIEVNVQDNDILIPSNQKSFYNESLSLRLVVQGPNSTLFSFNNGTSATSNRTKFTAIFTPSASDLGSYNISINISDRANLTSYIAFNLTVIEAATTTTTTSSGGGGGSSSSKPISLKIVMPQPMSTSKKSKIIVPIGLFNGGALDLKEIILEALITKNGILRKDILATFDKSFVPILSAGKSDNVTLIVDVNTEDLGLYEITINATVKTPKYNDWGKVYLTVSQDEKVQEKIIFTEEFIIGNPECAEFKEVVDEGKRLFGQGDITGAAIKLDEALDACRKAISQQYSPRSFIQSSNALFIYLTIAIFASAFIGLSVYYYKRYKIKRALRGY